MALFSYPVCTWLCQYVNMGVRKWLEKSAEKQKYKMRKTANPLSRKAFRAVSFSATKDKTPQNLLIFRSFSLFLLQNDQNAFKHFPAEKLAYSKAVKACLMTGFPPYFFLLALRLKQSMSRITRFEF